MTAKRNQKILQKLPDWITSRWNCVGFATLEETGYYPSFATFSSFFAKEAEIACNPISSQLALRTLETECSIQEKKSNVRTLSMSTTKSSGPNIDSLQDSSPSSAHQVTPAAATKSTRKSAFCHFCKVEHSIHHCKTFLKKKLEDRKSFVAKNHLCFGCLRKGHSLKGCKHWSTCATCQKHHPTFLHGDLSSTPSPKADGGTIKNNHKEVPPGGNQAVPSSVSHHTNIREGGSTSMIVPVWVSAAGQPNQEVLAYALLDTQNDTSFVLEDTAVALSAQKTPAQLKLSTMTSTECVLTL